MEAATGYDATPPVARSPEAPVAGARHRALALPRRRERGPRRVDRLRRDAGQHGPPRRSRGRRLLHRRPPEPGRIRAMGALRPSRRGERARASSGCAAISRSRRRPTIRWPARFAPVRRSSSANAARRRLVRRRPPGRDPRRGAPVVHRHADDRPRPDVRGDPLRRDRGVRTPLRRARSRPRRRSRAPRGRPRSTTRSSTRRPSRRRGRATS